MRKLFLDDSRDAPDFTWDTVRSYKEFVAYITLHGVPDVVSFDHDLADEHYTVWQETTYVEEHAEVHYRQFLEKTGYDCAKWLIERGTLPKEYHVHSLNPVGRQNIRFVMEAAYRRAQQGAIIQ